jgi:hypothetical protein
MKIRPNLTLIFTDVPRNSKFAVCVLNLNVLAMDNVKAVVNHVGCQIESGYSNS